MGMCIFELKARALCLRSISDDLHPVFVLFLRTTNEAWITNKQIMQINRVNFRNYLEFRKNPDIRNFSPSVD